MFCWGFNHLLNTLHDDEFLGAIPMNNMQELKIFIRSLIELYEDIMVKEGIKYDAFVNTLKFVSSFKLMVYIYGLLRKSQHIHILLAGNFVVSSVAI